LQKPTRTYKKHTFKSLQKLRALDRDSEGPPEQVAVVSSKPAATRGGGCDRDLSTASEPLVRDL